MASLPYTLSSGSMGAINVDKSGPGFSYNSAWINLRGAFPISITMPLKSERIASDTFLPWAANLLPESSHSELLDNFSGWRGAM